MESVASVRGMIPTSKQRRTDLYSVLDRWLEKPLDSCRLVCKRSKGEARVNCDHRMDERKVTDTIKVEDLGAKTVLCRCWKSNKFPLCDGQCSMDYDADGVAVTL